jgi:hypothetical protein
MSMGRGAVVCSAIAVSAIAWIGGCSSSSSGTVGSADGGGPNASEASTPSDDTNADAAQGSDVPVSSVPEAAADATEASDSAADASLGLMDASSGDAGSSIANCGPGDGDPCSVCDKAECCCYAAVGQGFCDAYSGAACRAASPDNQSYLISQCGIEVGAAQATNACL